MSDNNYTAFEYCYRDAANYKAVGAILLRGQYKVWHRTSIRERCDSREWFVAEQVGVPVLYDELRVYSDGPTVDDVAFHEFIELRPATHEEGRGLSLWGSLDDLVARFRNVNRWDCLLSPHAC